MLVRMIVDDESQQPPLHSVPHKLLFGEILVDQSAPSSSAIHTMAQGYVLVAGAHVWSYAASKYIIFSRYLRYVEADLTHVSEMLKLTKGRVDGRACLQSRPRVDRTKTLAKRRCC